MIYGIIGIDYTDLEDSKSARSDEKADHNDMHQISMTLSRAGPSKIRILANSYSPRNHQVLLHRYEISHKRCFGTLAAHFDIATTSPILEQRNAGLPTIRNATFGTPVAPKVSLWANTFEFGYLTAYNFSVRYNGPLLDSLFACTEDGEIYAFACGQELVSASQATALMLIPGIDFTKTYIIIGETGGANPKHATAGGATTSTFSVQWEWGGMFLDDDLPGLQIQRRTR